MAETLSFRQKAALKIAQAKSAAKRKLKSGKSSIKMKFQKAGGNRLKVKLKVGAKKMLSKGKASVKAGVKSVKKATGPTNRLRVKQKVGKVVRKVTGKTKTGSSANQTNKKGAASSQKTPVTKSQRSAFKARRTVSGLAKYKNRLKKKSKGNPTSSSGKVYNNPKFSLPHKTAKKKPAISTELPHKNRKK